MTFCLLLFSIPKVNSLRLEFIFCYLEFIYQFGFG